MQEWISVKDRLPGPQEDVLVYDSVYDFITIAHLIESYGTRDGKLVRCIEFEEACPDDDGLKKVTHWMPLPPMPEREDAGE